MQDGLLNGDNDAAARKRSLLVITFALLFLGDAILADCSGGITMVDVFLVEVNG
jgi:hypothetical protein